MIKSILIVLLVFITFESRAGWVRCASESGLCTFEGSTLVRFGADDSYVEQTHTSSVECSRKVFGDPAFGKSKHCDYYEEVINTTSHATYSSALVDILKRLTSTKFCSVRDIVLEEQEVYTVDKNGVVTLHPAKPVCEVNEVMMFALNFGGEAVEHEGVEYRPYLTSDGNHQPTWGITDTWIDLKKSRGFWFTSLPGVYRVEFDRKGSDCDGWSIDIGGRVVKAENSTDDMTMKFIVTLEDAGVGTLNFEHNGCDLSVYALRVYKI
jgi:hypothetical protein